MAAKSAQRCKGVYGCSNLSLINNPGVFRVSKIRDQIHVLAAAAMPRLQYIDIVSCPQMLICIRNFARLC